MKWVRTEIWPFELEPKRHVAAGAGLPLGIRVVDGAERRRTGVAGGAASRVRRRFRPLSRPDLDFHGPRERDVLAQVRPPAFDVQVVGARWCARGDVVRPGSGDWRRPSGMSRIEGPAEQIVRRRKRVKFRIDAILRERSGDLHIGGIDKLVELDHAADRLCVLCGPEKFGHQHPLAVFASPVSRRRIKKPAVVLNPGGVGSEDDIVV